MVKTKTSKDPFSCSLMSQADLKRFFFSIVLPSILAIFCFILAIFLIILPSSERNILEGKKEMISELTNSVCSLLEAYRQEAEDGLLSSDSAKLLASEQLSRIRYGDGSKNYFWITSEQPIMIMHPYRPELVGKDLSNYKDSRGRLLFVEAARMVEESGSGFIDYMWEGKDDSTRAVPRLSYVMGFEAWNWIVGTGIYLEELSQEIKSLRNKLLRIVAIIVVIISLLLAFIIRQSLGMQRRKKNTEDALLLSREKYKSLVEAATEGTLMMVEDSFIFSNFHFSSQSGFTPDEVSTFKFEDLFNLKLSTLTQEFHDPKKSISRETILKCSDGSSKEVVISVSLITYSEQTGYIIVVREVNSHMQYEKNRELLSGELQTLLMMMHQPMKAIAREIRKIHAEATIKEAIRIMSRSRSDILFVNHGEKIVGVINQNDLTDRVLATELDLENKVIEIMSSPVVTLPENALLYEGLLAMKKKALSHIALTGPKKKITGVVGFREMGAMQENLAGFLIKEIVVAEGVEQLKRIYKRLPVLIKALSDAGAHTRIITRIITSLGDAIHRRLIDLAMEEIGPAPCKFAFIALGSHGRCEQTLSTDQDNAIITVNMQESYRKEAKLYFQVLAKKVNLELDAVGYRSCPDEIMASNPKWNRELNGWKQYFSEWIQNGSAKNILDAAVFFDFRCIYGENILVEQLRTHVQKTLKGKGGFFYHMARSIAQMKIPARSDQHPMDMKKVLMPLVSYIRLHALRQGLTETGSAERAQELFQKEVLNARLHDELLHAFDYLTRLRIRSQAEKIARNEAPDNFTDCSQLSQSELLVLRNHLQNIASLQTRLSSEFSHPE